MAPHAVYILPVEIAEEDTLDFVAFVIHSSSDLYETDPLWKGYLLTVFFHQKKKNVDFFVLIHFVIHTVLAKPEWRQRRLDYKVLYRARETDGSMNS